MLAKKASFLLIIGAALSFPLTAAAQGKGVTSTAAGKGGVVTVDALVTRYQPLSGPWAPTDNKPNENTNPKFNATSLVNGLRDGGRISLHGPMLALKSITTQNPLPCKKPPCPSQPPTLVTEYKTIYFNSPVGPTGFGNVDIALALAETDATKNKQLNLPLTPEQMQAALVGGEVATAIGGRVKVTFTGVLALRAKGSGWGEVAKALNLELVDAK